MEEEEALLPHFQAWRPPDTCMLIHTHFLSLTHTYTLTHTLYHAPQAGPVLDKFDYRTGCPNDDALTQELMHQLVRSPALVGSCQQPFDEGMLWQAREPAERLKLEEQLQVRLCV